jgi:hypothetical protein
MTSTCISVRLTSASEYGHSKWTTGTVAYQCEKAASKGKFCAICARNGSPFGKIGASYTWEDGTSSTVPEYALKAGKMDDGTPVEKGEALCSVFANPLMDADGNMLVDDQEPLDDAYWQCDNEGDDEGEDEDEDEDEDEGESEGEDEDESASADDYKGILLKDIKKDLTSRDLSTEGRKKELIQRLVNNDNGADEDTSAPSKKSKTERKKRAPSAYNIYMSNNLAAYKKKHPSLAHKDAFCKVASLWANSDDNPANQ